MSSSLKNRPLNVLETHATYLREANPIIDWKIEECFIYIILNPERKIICKSYRVGGLSKDKEKEKHNIVQTNITSFLFLPGSHL